MKLRIEDSYKKWEIVKLPFGFLFYKLEGKEIFRLPNPININKQGSKFSWVYEALESIKLVTTT